MDYLVTLGCMALVLGAVLYLGYPLLASAPGVPGLDSAEPARQLLERKEQVYAAIKEIEFDHSLGKLPSEDYQRHRQQLGSEAVSLLQQLDQLDGRDGSGLRARIQREVLALRKTPDPGPGACPGCGAQRRGDERFCPQCGRALSGDAQS